MGEPVTATRVLACRSCGTPLPAPFLDLGETPVANRLLRDPDQAEDRFPLAVSHCAECGLVQLAQELSAADIFDADYPYYSSYSDSLTAASRQYAERLIAERGLGPGSLVVEVASNDGYLLQAFVERGVRVLGVEPSPGPAAAARERGVPTLEEFFGQEVAARLLAEHGPADVVIANNVMAHVPDLDDFVGGLAALVADRGVLTVENPSLAVLLDRVQFDMIYHEHYCYFSCLAVRRLFEAHGLGLVDVEDLPTQGGSLRWWGSRSGAPSAAVDEHLAAERALGLDRPETFAGLARRVTELQGRLVALLSGLKDEGRSLAAYGAAAKGATLLNTTGIDTALLDFVVDRNEHKQGLYMPGARLPILPVEALLDRQPDVVLLLAWNVADEVVRQQHEYRSRGGAFVVPVPVPVLL